MMNFKVYGTKIAINMFCYVKVRSKEIYQSFALTFDNRQTLSSFSILPNLAGVPMRPVTLQILPHCVIQVCLLPYQCNHM